MINGAPASGDFLWGVATSAYQSEGGYNGPGEPQTNWAAAEAARDVAPLGRAAEFWTRFRDDFALCRGLGLNAFRLSLEWSRIQPTRDNRPGPPPPFDYAALDHYATMLAACREAGLEPVVTLHHFVHPAWLGADPWLEEKTPELFARFVTETVRYVNGKLVETHGLAPIRYYITVNEPNMLALNTYLGHQFPSAAESGLRAFGTALTQLLRAHILACDVIHQLHREQAWPAPLVSLNNHCSDVYAADKLWLDILFLRSKNIPRAAAEEHLRAQSLHFAQAFRAAPFPLRPRAVLPFRGLLKRGLDALGRQVLQAYVLAPLLDAVYESPRTRLLDYIALDYYDPFAAHIFRLPVWWDHEFPNKTLRHWVLNSVTSKWWDWRVHPGGLRFFCQHYHEAFQLPLLIAENGMALRRPTNGSRRPRRDRLTRSRFLQLHLEEISRIRRSGLPLIGYFHWSLFDNYEWGTYTPRFGLYSIEFENGLERVTQDHLGDRPSETYARLISEARQASEAP